MLSTLPLNCTHLVKGGSYPEICAQRNAEDNGFLLSRLARRGGGRFLWFISRSEIQLINTAAS
jgi:hypothetical protein